MLEFLFKYWKKGQIVELKRFKRQITKNQANSSIQSQKRSLQVSNYNRYRQKSKMDPYWSSSEYFWQLSPGNGQFLVGFGIDGNWAWFCELLLTSFYQPLKLWRCVKRRPISIVQLFADQMKNVFCPIDDFFWNPLLIVMFWGSL